MSSGKHCPGSRQPVGLRDTRGKAWCGDCLRWYPACQDGTIRAHRGRPSEHTPWRPASRY